MTCLLTFGNNVWHLITGILNAREADSHVLKKKKREFMQQSFVQK
jgi:hypothetical protein